MKINEQANFTAYETNSGDIYIENQDGEQRLILSPSGSDEHERIALSIFKMDNDSLKTTFENA